MGGAPIPQRNDEFDDATPLLEIGDVSKTLYPLRGVPVAQGSWNTIMCRIVGFPAQRSILAEHAHPLAYAQWSAR